MVKYFPRSDSLLEQFPASFADKYTFFSPSLQLAGFTHTHTPIYHSVVSCQARADVQLTTSQSIGSPKLYILRWKVDVSGPLPQDALDLSGNRNTPIFDHQSYQIILS